MNYFYEEEKYTKISLTILTTIFNTNFKNNTASDPPITIKEVPKVLKLNAKYSPVIAKAIATRIDAVRRTLPIPPLVSSSPTNFFANIPHNPTAPPILIILTIKEPIPNTPTSPEPIATVLNTTNNTFCPVVLIPEVSVKVFAKINSIIKDKAILAPLIIEELITALKLNIEVNPTSPAIIATAINAPNNTFCPVVLI